MLTRIPQTLKVFGEGIAGVDAGDVGQHEFAQLGIFDESSFLKGRDFVVMDLHHIVIGQRVPCLIVDLETRIEFQHVQQLSKKKTIEKKNTN